jgi:hypothetical protein
MKLNMSFTQEGETKEECEELRFIKRAAIEFAKRLNIDGFWDADDDTTQPKKLDTPRYNIEWEYEWEGDGE